ncbi:MAG: GTPase [Oscillospiraceae bacterium]
MGKSTRFNAITNAGAEIANYPFCTIDPNVGMVAVPDERWTSWRRCMSRTKDAGCHRACGHRRLGKGPAGAKGLGNKFLANVRETDALVHVVRCFDDENVIHVEGSTEPARDIDIINTELVMADLEMVQRRVEKATKALKGDKKFQHEVDLFTALQKHLDGGQLARTFACDEDDAALLRTSDLFDPQARDLRRQHGRGGLCGPRS